MMSDTDEAIDDDIEDNELLLEDARDTDLTRLTDMVRKHYLNYLEKQLQENLINSHYNGKKNGLHKEDYDEMCKKSIKKTAELLEDKAVKACMITKIYQRVMVKIIAIVRRTTQERRLLTHLEKNIKSKEEPLPMKTSSKETQTEAGLLEYDITLFNNPTTTKNTQQNSSDYHGEEDKPLMSLDEKIEMFQKHLQQEKYNDIVKKYPLNNKDKKNKKRQQTQQSQHYHHHHEHNRVQHRHHHHDEQQPLHTRHTTTIQEAQFSPTSTIVTAAITPPPPTKQMLPEISLVEDHQTILEENDNSNDSVAAELARLFSEEKTELDEIFGIDPNGEPDDPQICKILKEIEGAKINHGNNTHVEMPSATGKIHNNSNHENLDTKCLNNTFLEPKTYIQTSNIKSECIDLSKSIWPCELFMQRRKLSDSLARLMDEDMRWHDVMKWKFFQLFGEDSDDEFTPCSPSIELNDVLIGSCIRRISPWVVQHLMKPMRHGLIGNRFLFKKLAKTLSRSIIMENQYPDEIIIKEYIENFFCLHQAVMSLDDVDVDMPSMSSSSF